MPARRRRSRWRRPSRRADAADANTSPAGKSVVYILDATGTMMGLKFKLLLAQMSDALDQLGPDDRFNLIFFQGGDTDAEWVLPFSTRLERANDANKQKAREFMERHKVVGKGTNPLPALRLAFKQKPDLIWFLTDGEFNNVVGYDQVVAGCASSTRPKRPASTPSPS